MYIAGSKGLVVFDITDRRRPSRIGNVLNTGCLTSDATAAMIADGSNLIIAGGKGLGLFSIADPAKPERLGNVVDTGCLSFSGGAGALIVDNTLFIAGGKGLGVFDCTLLLDAQQQGLQSSCDSQESKPTAFPILDFGNGQ